MFLVNLRYQMGRLELMLDGTLPRFVNLLLIARTSVKARNTDACPHFSINPH